ncbi:helix-turn-helix domain-containing protein [Mycobacterium malmoense]|uniref:PucR family transcriptional regulator n=1 Tax=Mycobacterium malmoense TaxID=1780 RepID=A0ABX3SRX3_MYCMA|nr:helix-turn-helix domain-containing protein [Mycobacterium malmoense]ORA82490.1 PucR family transcriptional regulator [Mycobacterium malmoense]QZA18039.1 helix-turn-helix domain-containing protein [Mycobacterium malmoense]UNB94815.1 helix-turn-helix domain-containing protein [Mycobacterium malmoense]
MADGSGAADAIVAKTAALVASRLDNRLAEATRAIQRLLVTEITELGGDAQLVQLLRDTVAANVDTFFSAVRNGIPVEHIEPPTAALEYARRLAQREVSANALVRAYRLGHRAALDVVLDEIRASELDPKLSLDVYERMAAVSFEYIDLISQRVVATYQDERERWLGNRNTLRALQVGDLLAGDEVDLDAATTAIRYPLMRIHVAIVTWCPEPTDGDGLGMMERFVRKLAESVGTEESPLFISVDRVTGWAWIPLQDNHGPDVPAKVRRFAEKAIDAPYLAVGDPLPGIEGFRRSHRQAQYGRSVTIASGAARRVVLASDPGLPLAALLGDNLGEAAAWVGEVLGPLARNTDADDRLRETLRVFLRTGSSHKAAAEELHLHSNSVKYRVHRAVERRGRPITDDRLDVEVALLLCHWFGTAMLR